MSTHAWDSTTLGKPESESRTQYDHQIKFSSTKFIHSTKEKVKFYDQNPTQDDQVYQMNEVICYTKNLMPYVIFLMHMAHPNGALSIEY